jgi:hypothetical protein
VRRKGLDANDAVKEAVGAFLRFYLTVLGLDHARRLDGLHEVRESPTLLGVMRGDHRSEELDIRTVEAQSMDGAEFGGGIPSEGLISGA